LFKFDRVTLRSTTGGSLYFDERKSEHSRTGVRVNLFEIQLKDACTDLAGKAAENAQHETIAKIGREMQDAPQFQWQERRSAIQVALSGWGTVAARGNGRFGHALEQRFDRWAVTVEESRVFGDGCFGLLYASGQQKRGYKCFAQGVER